MNEATIGFIGGGRITSVLLQGWTKAGKLPPSIAVADPNPDTLAKVRIRFPNVATGGCNAQVSRQDIVFLAVHPPAMATTLGEIQCSLKPNAVVISLAPKFTLGKIQNLLGGFARLARVIPNAPSVLGLGYNPITFSPALPIADRRELLDLLRPLGEFPEVEEDKLEGYAVLSAMGPTYLWFQLQALREAASGFGLSDAEIAAALDATVSGTTCTLLESGLSPAEVMDLVPVKPLAEMEPWVSDLYKTRLSAIYQKIKP